MNYKIRAREALLMRVLFFVDQHPEVLPEMASHLVPQLEAALQRLQGYRDDQNIGKSFTRGEAKRRKELAREVRQQLIGMATTARVLAKQGVSGLSGFTALPRSMSYHALETRAVADAKLVAPAEALFVQRGFAPDFLEQLLALVAKLRLSRERKFRWMNRRSRGTHGMEAVAKEVVLLVEDLGAMLTVVLRRERPELLEQWQELVRLRPQAKSRSAR